MDNYYVISLTSNLDDLNNDMTNWSNLPYEFRMRSNDECIRRYGMTNIDLYNKLKAMILSKTPIEDDPDLIGRYISESATYSINTDIMSNSLKIIMANELSSSPTIAIIPPNITTIESLDYIYNKYLLLNSRYKRFSNNYSINLFGYNVPNMYIILKDKIESNIIEDSIGEREPINTYRTIGTKISEASSDLMQPVEDEIDKLIFNDDKINLMKMKVISIDKSIENPVDKEINRRLISNINEAIKCNKFEYVLSKVTPWFTKTELENMDIEVDLSNINNSTQYYNEVTKAFKENNEEKLLSLGWNPSVDFNEKNIEYARNRQLLWLKENCSRVINLTNINSSQRALNESTEKMRNTYKKKNLYPVYIVLSFSYTFMGKIITKVKDYTYSHASISFDSDLKTLYTYTENVFDKKHCNGFVVEDIDTYIKNSDKAIISVLTLFVNKDIKQKLQDRIKYISENKTSFKSLNFLKIFFNIKQKNDPENLSMICSEFVDSLLKIVNIDITGKENSNLVTPQDFQSAKHPKVYQVYEGFCTEYDDKLVESRISDLFKKNKKEDILYTNMQSKMQESFSISDLNYNIIDNSKANTALRELNYLLIPQSAILEKAFPIKVKDDGTVSIKLMKSLEQEYQEAHKLLTTYTKENLEGIKHELARLFYVNNIIERKLKRMKKDEEKRKKLVDLRARVLNDFKKYLKLVLEEEPNFDFTEYFKKSEYYDAALDIDKDTLEALAKLLKIILKK